jgi:hypothetical protein
VDDEAPENFGFSFHVDFQLEILIKCSAYLVVLVRHDRGLHALGYIEARRAAPLLALCDLGRPCRASLAGGRCG